MIPTATRLMHSRHLSLRASSCLRSSCNGCSQRCRASACGRVMWTTNRGSGNGPLISMRGGASNSFWTSAGRGMSAGHERASSTNSQHSGVNLTVTSGGYTTSTTPRASDSGCGRLSGQAINLGAKHYPGHAASARSSSDPRRHRQRVLGVRAVTGRGRVLIVDGGPAGRPDEERRDNYHWVCSTCFDDFRGYFDWTIGA
jgi:hypothetical protein